MFTTQIHRTAGADEDFEFDTPEEVADFLRDEVLPDARVRRVVVLCNGSIVSELTR